MYKVRIDVHKNRIYILVKGKISERDIREGCQEFIQELHKLKAPVDVINDISEYQPESNIDFIFVKMTQKILVEYGLHRCIRVVRNNIEGTLPFVAGSIEAGYHSELAYTMDEAERMLDEDLPEQQIVNHSF